MIFSYYVNDLKYQSYLLLNFPCFYFFVTYMFCRYAYNISQVFKFGHRIKSGYFLNHSTSSQESEKDKLKHMTSNENSPSPLQEN